MASEGRQAETMRWHELVFDSESWRDALIAWLAQRLAFITIFQLSTWWFGRRGVSPGASLSSAVTTSPWLNWWDTGHYIDIARAGYTTPDQSVFYPLYPLAEKIGAGPLGGSYVFAGFVVSNLACLGAMIAFRILAGYELDRRRARVALALFTFAPAALYLAVTYSESLFLMLVISSVIAIRRRWWIAAGLTSALAVLTRQAGLLLLIPYAIEAAGCLRAKRDAPSVLQVVVGGALPLTAFLGFAVYIGARFHSPLIVLTAEHTYYNRYLDWPWVGPLQAAGVAMTGSISNRLNATYDLAVVAAIGVATAITAFRSRLPIAYRAYVVIGFVGLLMLPTHDYGIGEDLNGLVRYLLVLFPVWLGLAAWSTGRRGLTAVTLATCVLGFVVTSFDFGHPPLVL